MSTPGTRTVSGVVWTCERPDWWTSLLGGVCLEAERWHFYPIQLPDETSALDRKTLPMAMRAAKEFQQGSLPRLLAERRARDAALRERITARQIDALVTLLEPLPTRVFETDDEEDEAA